MEQYYSDPDYYRVYEEQLERKQEVLHKVEHTLMQMDEDVKFLKNALADSIEAREIVKDNKSSMLSIQYYFESVMKAAGVL